MSTQSNLAFQTERFDVFAFLVERNPDIGMPRTVYTAWHRHEDIPRSLCEVTVSPFWRFVEWLHVDEHHRRQGIATEVMKGLEKHLGELDFDGATEAGRGFCAAWDRAAESGEGG